MNDTTPPPAAPSPTAVAPAVASRPQVRDDSEFAVLLDSDRFAQVQRVANLFAQSNLVPEVFQGKPANCAVALQMAFRMRVDPMMLMQNMYIVHGRPGIEAKLAIALMNSRGPFTGPLQWRLEGDGDDRSWTCFATHRETQERCEATVTWKMVVAEGWHKPRGKGDYQQASKWTTLPDLMGRYRSAMFLGRLYCPEVLLGLPTNDELVDVGAHVERAVQGARVIDDEPIPLPTERSNGAAVEAAPTDQAGADAPVPAAPTRDSANGTHEAGAPLDPPKQSAALTPSSEVQRSMVRTVAKQAGVADDAIDGLMIDKFAFVLDDMPAQMFGNVVAHFKALR